MDAIGPESTLLRVCESCGRAISGDHMCQVTMGVYVARTVEYVRADLHAGAVGTEREQIVALVERAAEDALDERVAAALDVVAARIRQRGAVGP